MNVKFLDSILYFIAFIPLVMVPIVVMQIGPYVVIKGIKTLMKADAEEGSAERYFGITPEEKDCQDEKEELLEIDTYKVNRQEVEDKLHIKQYIGAKILSVLTVSIILGSCYVKGVFDATSMVHYLMSKMTFVFLGCVLFYAVSMMALFGQFKEVKYGRRVASLIFYLDGLLVGIIIGIIVATFRF